MVDHDRGDAPLLVHVEDVPGQRLLLFGVHACHRLVQQQELGLQGEGAPQLHQLLAPIGEVADAVAPHGLKLQKVDDALYLFPVLDLPRLLASPIQAATQNAPGHVSVTPQHQIVEHAHVLEQLDVLEGAGDAQPGDAVRRKTVDPMLGTGLVGQRDGPLLSPVQPAQAVQKACLARTVGADQRLKRATAEGDADVLERRHPTEVEREPLHPDLPLRGRRTVGPDSDLRIREHGRSRRYH